MSFLVKRKQDSFLDTFDVFDKFFSNSSGLSQRNYIREDIRESEKEYILRLAIPGIDKNNLNISLKNKLLTISYEDKNETENTFNYSSFSKSWQIQEDVREDLIEAEYLDGILKLILPKTELKLKDRKIEIR